MSVHDQYSFIPIKVERSPVLLPLKEAPPLDLDIHGQALVRSLVSMLGIKNPQALADMYKSITDPTSLNIDKIIHAAKAGSFPNPPLSLSKTLTAFGLGHTALIEGKAIGKGMKAFDLINRKGAFNPQGLQLALGASLIARSLGLDPLFAAASATSIAYGESGGSLTAMNKKSGAFGLLQILPGTWRDILNRGEVANINAVLKDSPYYTMLGRYFNENSYSLSHGVTYKECIAHPVRQYPVMLAQYALLNRQVDSLFEYKDGWKPKSSAVHQQQWDKIQYARQYLRTYSAGRQVLLTCLHINGLYFFESNNEVAHKVRLLSDPALVGALLLHRAFRQVYNSLLTSLKTSTPSSGDPFDQLRPDSNYGMRTRKVNGTRITRMHYGVDYFLKKGTPLYAPFAGHITFSGFSKTAGYMVQLKDDRTGNVIELFHLNEKGAPEGYVKQGSLIGHVGSSGLSEGPHLHLGAFNSEGARVNPLSLGYNYKLLLKSKI